MFEYKMLKSIGAQKPQQIKHETKSSISNVYH